MACRNAGHFLVLCRTSAESLSGIGIDSTRASCAHQQTPL